MKWMSKLKNTLTGLTNAITRFPLTTIFLLTAAIINAYEISTNKDGSKLLLTFVVGAFLSAAAQTAYERFSSKTTNKLILMGIVVLLTVGYYFIIRPAPELGMEIEIRTAVSLFTLFIAFIWIPVIKSKITFNKSFMIAFKSFFNSLFFSSVIFAGISIILSAINLLIFTIDYSAFSHTSNIVFVLFAPMYFLSLIPLYPRPTNETPEKMNEIEKSAHCPKFLEILLSYIIIPLIAVFTLILIIYIFKNIRGEFWSNNLLEPMLVSYSTTVIFVYILASEIENKFTSFFRRIFPKVLVPIVLFQITSSILSLADTGITHTRYYVILFGIFAAAAGILLSFLPEKRNGIVALILIIFAVISIVPPVDAFTVSRNSQTNTLKSVLIKNNMLDNTQITPNDSISNKDKKKITNAVNYLNMMGYSKDIKWLPQNKDFYNTFGFQEYYEQGNIDQGVYLSLKQPSPITIKGFDTFVQTDIMTTVQNSDKKICTFKNGGKNYTLSKDFKNGQVELELMDDNNQKLINFKTKQIYDRFYQYQAIKDQISVKEATFVSENNHAKITVIVQNVGIDKANTQNNNASIFVFIQIK